MGSLPEQGKAQLCSPLPSCPKEIFYKIQHHTLMGLASPVCRFTRLRAAGRAEALVFVTALAKLGFLLIFREKPGKQGNASLSISSLLPKQEYS